MLGGHRYIDFTDTPLRSTGEARDRFCVDCAGHGLIFDLKPHRLISPTTTTPGQQVSALENETGGNAILFSYVHCKCVNSGEAMGEI
jgi:hypothetical protein